MLRIGEQRGAADGGHPGLRRRIGDVQPGRRIAICAQVAGTDEYRLALRGELGQHRVFGGERGRLDVVFVHAIRHADRGRRAVVGHGRQAVDERDRETVRAVLVDEDLLGRRVHADLHVDVQHRFQFDLGIVDAAAVAVDVAYDDRHLGQLVFGEIRVHVRLEEAALLEHCQRLRLGRSDLRGNGVQRAKVGRGVATGGSVGRGHGRLVGGLDARHWLEVIGARESDYVGDLAGDGQRQPGGVIGRIEGGAVLVLEVAERDTEGGFDRRGGAGDGQHRS